MSERKTWTPADVVDVSGPPALVRNYLEQAAVRRYLQQAALATPILLARDVGCGFGRLTPVLAETAGEVTASSAKRRFEIAWEARCRTAVRTVSALDRLPVSDGSAQFVLTFTVVQHMLDERAAEVLAELQRVLTRGGHLLLAEETDPSLEAGDRSNADLGYTWTIRHVHRPLRRSALETAPRRIEPGYPRPDVGTHAVPQAMTSRVLPLHDAVALVADLRAAGKVVVFTNGHDLIHPGHVRYLQRAARRRRSSSA
jgi:SAM-dependent methyltransferase